MYKKMLVPLDGSKLAECVLPHVEELTRCCKIQELILLSICDTAPADVHFPSNAPEEVRNRYQDTVPFKEQCLLYLDGVSQSLKELCPNIKTEYRIGNAAAEITDCAAENVVDLIVMASHGRSGISRWAYGSVAEKVMRSTTVPVLMVRAPDCVPGV